MIPLVLVLLGLLGMVEPGTHLDEPWFRWNDGKVPFYFQNIQNADRRVIRKAMKSIEQKTCFRFQEEEGPLSGHHLVVRGSTTTCLSGPGGVPSFSATVGAVPPAMKQVVLQSYFQVADSQRCVDESRGGLLHELFHVFGMMHTQKRPDRDRYVRILKENIQDQYESSYDICHQCKDYGVPYDCDSIMHSGAETFSTGLPTMETRNSSCNLKWVGAAFDGRHGSEVASKWDWELLRRIASRLCSSPSFSQSRNTQRPKIDTNTLRTTRRPNNKTGTTRRPNNKTTRNKPKPTRRLNNNRKPKKNRSSGNANTQKSKITRNSKIKTEKVLPPPWKRRPKQT